LLGWLSVKTCPLVIANKTKLIMISFVMSLINFISLFTYE